MASSNPCYPLDRNGQLGGMTEEVSRYRSVCGWVVLGYILALLILPPLVGFRLDYRGVAQLYAVVAIPAITLPYVRWRKLTAIQPAVEVTVFVLAILPTFLVLTFAAMRMNFPLQDALLVRLDQAMGFDWPSYLRLVDRSAIASVVLAAAYESVFFQLTLLPLLLCASKLAGRAYQLVACYGLLVAISTAIAVFFPSVSAYGGHAFDSSTLSNVNSYNGYFFLKSFDAIRTDPNFVLGAGTAAGIVTFPSIHAGVAALLAWGAWPSPILRYPFLLLNVLMAVGAITHGAHYLVDILAGLAIAWLVERLSQWLAGRAGARRTYVLAGAGSS